MADAAGDAYVTGYTNQATFPATAGAYQTTCDQYGVNGNTDANCNAAFIAKLNPNGTALLASTYFGGYYAGANNTPDNVVSMGPIVLDAAGNAYCTSTVSPRTGCRKSIRWVPTMAPGVRPRHSSRSSIRA